jgi:hypothetical protein
MKLLPHEAITLISNQLHFAERFALEALDAALTAKPLGNALLVKGSITLFQEGRLPGEIDVRVDAPNVDLTKSVRDSVRASRVAFRRSDADPAQPCVIGSINGTDCLRIRVRPDGMLYVETGTAAILD